MNNKLFIAIIFLLSQVIGQDYLWPVTTGTSLSSNFGEFRPGHFHMGIDIRTNQTEGHPILAIESGFISRISTKFSGYGKALYLTLGDGRKALFGHMSSYKPDLEAHLRQLQDENQSYNINQWFSADEYPVERGDTIGWSGNTGGSFGPHVHFELRNSADQTLNPLTNGYQLRDKVPPVFNDITFIPVTARTFINGIPFPVTFSANPDDTIFSPLPDTLNISGPFVIAVSAVDKIQYAINTYQFYQCVVKWDEAEIFSISYDSLDFAQDLFVETMHGQPINHGNRNKVHKLYRYNIYPVLKNHGSSSSGRINPEQGLHNLTIEIVDPAGNAATLSVAVQGVIYNPLARAEKSYENNLSLNGLSANFKARILPFYLEKGCFLIISTSAPLGIAPAIRFSKNGTNQTMSIFKTGVNKYSTFLLNPAVLSGTRNFRLIDNNRSIYEFTDDRQYQLFNQIDETSVYSIDGSCKITAGTEAFFDSTLLWIDNDNNFPVGLSRRLIRSKIYHLRPAGIPLNEPIDIGILTNIEAISTLNQLAVYYYNYKQNRWEYSKSKFDPKTNFMETSLDRFETVALLLDDTPPTVKAVNIENLRSYPQDQLSEIQAELYDDLSGFEAQEASFVMSIDGQRLLAEYQPIDKELKYKLSRPLDIGGHELTIQIKDRAGNSSTVRIKFSIE